MFKLFLFAPLVILVFIFAILPIIKYIRSFNPKSNPVKEARVRLQLAKDELEAAKLNKEAEQLYEKMYQEAIDNYDSEVKNQNGREK